MIPVTLTDRVTPETESRADRVTSVVGKKALCAHLGWSRPALDRRLLWDKNFPVLHCGKAGDAWRFDLRAVVAHVESSSGRRDRPPRATRRPLRIGTTSTTGDLERVVTITRAIADLVSELGQLLERLDAALGLSSEPSALTSADESVNGNDH